MKKTNKRILSWLLTAVMLLSLCLPAVNVFAQESENETGFFRGVCGHSYNRPAYSADTVETQLHLAAELGANLYRVDVYNTDEEGFEWLNNILLLCEHYGIEPMLIVYNPETASAVAEQFGERVTYYQMNNELDAQAIISSDVDGSKAEHYNSDTLAEKANLVKNIAAAIRAEDNEATLIVNGTWKHFYYIQYLIGNGVDFDMIGWDWYSNMDNDSGNIYECSLALEEFGKPYMFTELNAHPSADDDKGTYICEMLTFLETSAEGGELPNYRGAAVYELLDEPAEKNEHEKNFGLVSMTDEKAIGDVKADYTVVQDFFGGGEVPFYELPKEVYEDLPIFSFEEANGEAKAPQYTGFDPQWNTDAAYISEGAGSLRKPLGKSSVYANTFYVNSENGVNLKGYKTIKLDIYVADINTYNAYWHNKLVLQFFNGNIVPDDKKVPAVWYPINDELRQGWNTVCIDISEISDKLTDVKAIRLYSGDAAKERYYVRENTNSGNYTPETADCETVLYFDNCRASYETEVQGELLISSCDQKAGANDFIAPVYTGTGLDASYEKNIITQGSGSIRKELNELSIWNNCLIHDFDAVDLSGYQTLKFDLYISDILTFNKYWAGNLGVQLFEPGSKDYAKSQYYALFPNHGLKQGWNTLSFTINEHAAAGKLTNIGKIRLTTMNKENCWLGESLNPSDKRTLPTDPECRTVIYIDNIRASERAEVLFDADKKSNAADNPEYISPQYIGDYKKEFSSDYVFDGTHSMKSVIDLSDVWKNAVFTKMSPVNIAEASEISFEMYIREEDISEWREYYDGHIFFQLFNVINQKDTPALYYAYLPSNLNAGWNHISFNVASVSAEFDSVASLRFSFGDTANAGLNKASSWNNDIGYKVDGGAPGIAVYFDDFRVSYEKSAVIANCENASSGTGMIGSDYEGKGLNADIKTEGNASVLVPLSDKSYHHNRFYIKTNGVFDLKGANAVSFDFFIPDIEVYDTYWDGHMYFQLYSAEKISDYTKSVFYKAFPRNLKEGWNKIYIDISEKANELNGITAVGVVQVNNPNNPWSAESWHPNGDYKPADAACAIDVLYDNFRLEYEKTGFSFNNGTVKENAVAFDSALTADSFIRSTRLEKTFMKVSANGNIGTGSSVEIFNLYGERLAQFDTVLYGDVSGDGYVNAADLVIIRKTLMAADKLEGAYAMASDANNDGEFDIRDLINAKKKAS